VVRLFLSHSSRDAALVERLVELIRAGLRLSSTEIRCTTIDGYRLPAGVNTDDRLRAEILEVPVLIGLISAASFESAYVLFELGARWGNRKTLIPLLAPGVSTSILRGPLTALNALSCSHGAQLHQLISDLSTILQVTPEPPAAYQRYVDAITAYPPQQTGLRPLSPPVTSSPPPSASPNAITAHSPQQTGLQHLPPPVTAGPSASASPNRPTDIPPEVFQTIRATARQRFPTDFTMQEFVEQQEIQAYRRIYGPPKQGAT
jgi:hypothetical protein